MLVNSKIIREIFNKSQLNIVFENEAKLQNHIERIKPGVQLTGLDLIIIQELINLIPTNQ